MKCDLKGDGPTASPQEPAEPVKSAFDYELASNSAPGFGLKPLLVTRLF